MNKKIWDIYAPILKDDGLLIAPNFVNHKKGLLAPHGRGF